MRRETAAVGGGSPRHRGWAGRPGGGRGPRAPALLVVLSPPGAQAWSYCCCHTGRGSPTPGSQTALTSRRGSRSLPTWAHRTRGCLSQGERADPLAGLSRALGQQPWLSGSFSNIRQSRNTLFLKVCPGTGFPASKPESSQSQPGAPTHELQWGEHPRMDAPRIDTWTESPG